MQAREDFHKAQLSRFVMVLGVLATGFAAGACAPSEEASAVVASRVPVAEAATLTRDLPPTGHAWVIFGADTVVAEVASTADEREKGLMYREQVPDGTGMLFVFTDNQVRSFWMANTYVALDIAYMDPSFRIVDIVAMQPLTTETHPSAAPAMYGLEVRQGWYAEQDIREGARAEVVFGVLGR